MRNSIKLFEDQYSLYKAFKSKKLLVAFVEFMFEDIEPKNLTEKEESIFNSLRERMENSKKIIDGNSKGGKTSHGGGRKGNDSGEPQTTNKSKTTQKQVNEQVKNNEEEDNISKDILLEDEVEVKDGKKRYLENVWLLDDEYIKLIKKYGSKKIDEYINKLNYYIDNHGDKYSSHYKTMLNRMRKANEKELDRPKPTLDYDDDLGIEIRR